MSQLEEHAYVQARNSTWPGWPSRRWSAVWPCALKSAALQPGCQVVGDGAVGGWAASSRLPSDSRSASGRARWRGLQGADLPAFLALHGESQLAGDSQAHAAQSFDASHVDPRAVGVQLEAVDERF